MAKLSKEDQAIVDAIRKQAKEDIAEADERGETEVWGKAADTTGFVVGGMSLFDRWQAGELTGEEREELSRKSNEREAGRRDEAGR